MKGLDKVGGEMGLTVLAYNMKRVIKIVELRKLIAGLMTKSNKLFNYATDIFIKLFKIIIQRQKVIYNRLIYANSFTFHTV